MTDYISRADAIERIANDNVVGGMDRINEYRNSNEHNDYLDGISTAIATVDDLPSADAVQGEWVIRENGNIECSLCGHERQDGWDYFCGYCGARMEKIK